MVNTGYAQSLYYGVEGQYGKATTINKDMGIVQSISPTETNNIIKVRKMGGTRDYSNLVPGKFEVSGSFEYMLQDCDFIKFAVGEDSATTVMNGGPVAVLSGGAGSSYHHVMGSVTGPTGTAFPSFNLEFNDDETGQAQTFKRKYTGCIVNTLTISSDVDSPVNVAVDFQAQGVHVATSGATSVTEQTVDPFVFYQGQLYLTTGAIGGTTLSIGTVAELNAFSLTLNNNLEPVWYISGTTNIYQDLRGLKALLPKGRDYSGNVSLGFKNWTQFKRFLGSDTATTSQGTLTKYQAIIDLVRVGGPVRATAAANDWMRIILASCTFDNADIPGSPEDIVNESYDLMVKSAKIHVFDDNSSAY